MATTAQSLVPLTDSKALAGFLGSKFPNYKISPRGGKVVVIGTGAATGIGVIIRGPNEVKINWQFPNMGVQMVLMLAIIFSGFPATRFISIFLAGHAPDEAKGGT